MTAAEIIEKAGGVRALQAIFLANGETVSVQAIYQWQRGKLPRLREMQLRKWKPHFWRNAT